MVAKLLPEPMLFTNPRYRSAAPMKKWLLNEVEHVEQTSDFKILFEKASKRRDAGYMAASKRREETLKQVRSIIANLQVAIWPNNILERETIAVKEDWEEQHGNYNGVYNVPESVLVRWEVNFIRHNLTNYDAVLEMLFGVVGKAEAYSLLKSAVLDKIGEAYPYLQAECQRQKGVMK